MKATSKGEALAIAFPSDREIVVTRRFDAPRERVFEACTDHDLIPQWWGPRGLTTTVEKLDLRPGGTWRFVQRDQAGNVFAFNGAYREVVPPERLVETFEYEGMPGHDLVQSSTLEAEDGGTKLTVRSIYKTPEDRDGMYKSGMEQGLSESYERLDELLAKMADELIITRVFDAPRELVWKAWTEPERAKQWWGPKVYTAPSLETDLRVGGKYLYCMRGPDGKDIWSTGVFKEIDPPHKLVMTDSFADENGNVVPSTYYGMSPGFPLEVLATVILEEQGDKTKFTLWHEIPASLPDHEGARQGWNESLDKLADYLSRAQ